MVIEQCKYFLCMNRSNDTWHQDIDDILTDSGKHFFIRFQLGSFAVVGRLDEIIMLGRNYNCIDADRRTVIIVFNSYLTLGVRTEISHFFTFATDVGQHLQDAMCQVERKRHVVFCFVSSIAKHHALVACTLLHRVLTFYTTVNVGALLMNGGQYTARVTFEHVLAFGIADFLNYFARNELQINVRFGFHFSSQYHLSGSYQSFASYFRTGVVSQQFVKHSVRYLIGHFVGVSF